MTSSIFFARLLAPVCIIIAAGLIRNPKTYQKMIDDFCKSSALIYLGGFISLFFGVTIVLLHNVWVLDWPVLITLWGWAGIVKGVWLIVFPETLPIFVRSYKKNKNLLEIQAAAILIFGAALAYFGFYAPWR